MHPRINFVSFISPLSGARFQTFLTIFSGKKIDLRYSPKWILSFLIMLFSSPFRWWETVRWKRRIEAVKLHKPPVFILGHWRSGTTYLHNLLCCDSNAAYFTTYHGVFPNVLFSGKWLFKNFMRISMPRKRAVDGVQLSADFPQEEEFALANVNPNSFYNWWYFPMFTQDYYKR